MKQLLAPRKEARRSKAAALAAIFDGDTAGLVPVPCTSVRFVVAHSPRYIPLDYYGSCYAKARYHGRNDETTSAFMMKHEPPL